ncbi:hypothetical protein [Tepidibacillus fermentans]|uniref:Uncharacterized protein n=1 Tax=Tepidibacillus fermentans TaxID=1281767 RepID=A0A4R3KJU8_9BACI|nr:hypothetical protein [Tepidibacillus fermentans]TCS83592.1 hypothetical protein EDD72_104147 [Tepidibacillus fermentans]
MRMVKSIIYFILALASLFYALPRIPLFQANSTDQMFAIAWIIFALLVVGAHLDQLLLSDEDKRKHLARIRNYQRLKKEQELLRFQSQGKRMVKER